MELFEPAFGEKPKGLDSVDITFTLCILVQPVVYPEVFLVSLIHQAITASPVVWVDDTISLNFSSYYALQHPLGVIWNDLGINLTASFQDTKNRSFSNSSAAPLAFDSLRLKVRSVNLHLAMKRKSLLAILRDPFSEQPQVAVNRVAI
jgi:hypothetical protein